MNLAEYDVIRLQEFLARLKPQSASYLDLIGQPDNSTTPITGHIGEYTSATVAFGSAVSLTTNTVANVTSLSLSAGDWDVWGTVYYTGNAATTVTDIITSISTTSATENTSNGNWASNYFNGETVFAGSAIQNIVIPPVRAQLSAATTYYLTARAVFAVNSASAYGIIQARRCRHFPG